MWLLDALLPQFSDHQVGYKRVYQSTSATLEEDPENAAALFERGLACQALRWYPQAVDDFTEVVRLRPSQARAWMLLSEVLESVGRYEESRAARQQSLELDPKANQLFRADVPDEPLTKERSSIQEAENDQPR